HLTRRIRCDSTATHHIHLVAEVKRSGFPGGSWYCRYRAERVSDRVKAERVRGIDYCTTLVIRGACHVNHAAYGGCGRVHDAFRCGHRGHCPLRADGAIGIKGPYLVGGSYVDVEPAQSVQLVVKDRETAG